MGGGKKSAGKWFVNSAPAGADAREGTSREASMLKEAVKASCEPPLQRRMRRRGRKRGNRCGHGGIDTDKRLQFEREKARSIAPAHGQRQAHNQQVAL